MRKTLRVVFAFVFLFTSARHSLAICRTRRERPALEPRPVSEQTGDALGHLASEL